MGRYTKLITIVVFCISTAGAFYLANQYALGNLRFPVKAQKTVASVPQVAPAQIDEDKLWTVVNEWKYEEDGYSFSKNANLCEYADIRAKQIKTDWSHEGVKDFYPLIYSHGFHNAGENLGRDIVREDYLLNSWLNSPTHRANLEKNYTHSCIRCEDNYCVQLFASY